MPLKKKAPNPILSALYDASFNWHDVNFTVKRGEISTTINLAFKCQQNNDKYDIHDYLSLETIF